MENCVSEIDIVLFLTSQAEYSAAASAAAAVVVPTRQLPWRALYLRGISWLRLHTGMHGMNYAYNDIILLSNVLIRQYAKNIG